MFTGPSLAEASGRTKAVMWEEVEVRFWAFAPDMLYTAHPPLHHALFCILSGAALCTET